MDSTAFFKKISKWYRRENRPLPWRKTKDPYKIWLSEIIMQQTRVNQGLPYYLEFLRIFPSLKSLSSADEEQVLRAWQGLGYYSRARNLLKCSHVLMKDLNGRFPQSYDQLQTLPGIGPYTAAAIASFAFNQSVPAIDGNALRVFSRYFGIKEDIRKNKTINLIRNKASALMINGEPAIFNQATMELGAIVCLPTNPRCAECPIQTGCVARRNDLIGEIPFKSRSKPTISRFFNYLIFRDDLKIALRRRTSSDIWKGLFEFYLVESDRLLNPDELDNTLVESIRSEISQVEVLGPDTRHQLSHQTINSRFIEMSISGLGNIGLNEFESFGLRFYSEAEIVDLPKPVLIDNILKDYIV